MTNRDPLRWYVLTSDRDNLPGQQAYEMLASEASERNATLRSANSDLRWTQDLSKGER